MFEAICDAIVSGVVCTEVPTINNYVALVMGRLYQKEADTRSIGMYFSFDNFAVNNLKSKGYLQ